MPPAAAPAAAGAAGAEGNPPPPQQRGGMLAGLLRMAFMWWAMKQFMAGGGKKPAAAPAGQAAQPSHLSPSLPRASLVDVHVFVSEDPGWQRAARSAPVWTERGVPLGSTEPRHLRYTYRPSSAVQNNGSVYVHAVFSPSGAAPDPSSPDFDPVLTWAKSHQLNAWMPKRKARDGKNLLSGKNSTDGAALPDDTVAANETVTLTSYLKPNVTIVLVDDFSRYPSHQIPPHYRGIIEVDTNTSTYAPLVWFNDFWLLRDYMVPVNDSLLELPLDLTIQALPHWKVAIYTQMELSFAMQSQWGMSSGDEADEVKRIFLEGNPFFLALTMAVSLLHSVFDMLAFKNDIGFWKDNKSMLGLSARTILINAGCQLVIFLYLLDSETSMVVLASAGVGTAIEFWKVTKAMDVSIAHTARGLPYLRIRDRQSYIQTKTEQYDAEAMRYLSYALYPLVAGYAVYSLMYKTHTSWYSWVLHSLVGAVYAFGFILMCPQLYLNYKLKSVAHLPWRQMTYKFLNTIIDDLFAFVIKMPLLHRLSVFRDDIVFLVYIYQRWIYRVDKTRANEFGYVERAEGAGGDAAEPPRLASGAAEVVGGDEAAGGTSSAAAEEEESKKEK